jgi:hypothetical protein
MNINPAHSQQTARSYTTTPAITSKLTSELPSTAKSVPNPSRPAFDMALGADSDLSQQIDRIVSLIKTLLEALGHSEGNANAPSAADPLTTDPVRQANPSLTSSGEEASNVFSNKIPAEVDGPRQGNVSGSNSKLPAINAKDWSTRDGKNGEEFATPFVSKNVLKNDNSITAQLKGNEGAEAILDKQIGTGFYQFNVNPKLSSQVGDIPTVFFYSGKGSDGGDYEGGFELDAEYNMVKQGTVTFGTWIDGKKYNEVTVPAPKGDQTIGFNIQNGVSQIGFVNADGTFEPVSETKDKRITPELASNLQAMTNTWRSKSTGGVG